LLLVAGLVGPGPGVAAPLTGPEILKRALDLQAGIQDYTATIKVTVNMPGVQVPERTATLYFKRPDKVHVDSKSLIMLPRKALFMGDLGSELNRRARVVLAGQSRRDGAPVFFLKVLPPAKEGTSDRMSVWVRSDRFTIERLEVYAGGRRELSVQWEHQLVAGRYWLIRRLVAQVPGGRTGYRHRGPVDPDEQPRPATSGPGTITVEFSNLRVNTGLPDSLFVEPKR
jgi:outer membrane lipoprotein-sorting protein